MLIKFDIRKENPFWYPRYSHRLLGKYDRYFEEYLFIEDFQKFLYVTYDAEWRLVRAEVL